MKRLYLLVVVSVVGAAVLSMAINLFVVRAFVAHDRDDALRLLRPDVAGTFGPVAHHLAANAERDPAALSAALGVPVTRLDAAEVDALDALPRVDVRLATGERLSVDASARPVKDFAFVTTRAGDVLRVGPLPHATFFSADRLSMWLAILVVAAMVTSLLITFPLARGLGRLERAARALAAGDLSARAPAARGATRELSLAFNTMADRVQALLVNQQHLLQAVSHELRTPTARIRFSLEMLADATTDAARAKRLDAIDKDLDELDELVSELVTFSRVAADVDERDAHPLAVAPALDDLAADVRERRPDVALEVRGPANPDDAAVLVEARSFRRAMRNLALNAVRYCDGRVDVSWQIDGDRVVITLDDDGPGVPEADRDRVFEPFTRADASRSRDSGGVGLGLAIVRRILEVHGGRVHVEASPLGGARFVTRWPRARPSAHASRPAPPTHARTAPDTEPDTEPPRDHDTNATARSRRGAHPSS